MKVLALSGSLRRDSYNTKLLHAAARLLPEGTELELWDGLKAVPPYDEDDDVEPAPAPVAALRAAIAGADALLFATPEYNSSVPGQLKNALDWVSRPLATNPLRNLPVAVIGASTGGFGAVWAQAELRKVLSAVGARVVEDGVAAALQHELRLRDDASVCRGRHARRNLPGCVLGRRRGDGAPLGVPGVTALHEEDVRAAARLAHRRGGRGRRADARAPADRPRRPGRDGRRSAHGPREPRHAGRPARARSPALAAPCRRAARAVRPGRR